MDGFTSQTSAFRTMPDPELLTKAPLHHSELWNAIKGGLATGRTYNFARCCSCIFDSRKKDSDKPELNHTESESMARFLGKRAFTTFDEFSNAVLRAEKTLKKPLDKISFNRSHFETQNSIMIDEMKTKIAELEEKITSITDDHERRIRDLELQNGDLKNLLSKEISAQRAVVAASQKALAFKDKLCLQCLHRMNKDL